MKYVVQNICITIIVRIVTTCKKRVELSIFMFFAVVTLVVLHMLNTPQVKKLRMIRILTKLKIWEVRSRLLA